MPVVISRAHLTELMRSDEELVRVMELVERSLSERHNGPAGHALFSDLPLDGGEGFKVMGCSAPGNAPTLRIFPWRTVRDAPEDRHLILRFHPATGALQTIICSDDLNPLRTSVPAAVAARHLAPPGARVLGVLGSGAQARGHARMICRALPSIDKLLVWSPTPENREAYAAEQASVLAVDVSPCASAERVVRGADVVSATGRLTGGAPAFEADWVKPGALTISMTSSSPPALRDRSRFVVPTTNRPELVAFGFANRAAPHGGGDEPESVVELADIIAGRIAARLSDDQPVVFELANVYLWDQPIAAWADEWARRNGLGQPVVLSDS